MKLYNIHGNLVSKNVNKYAIDWNGPSKSKLQFQVKQFLKPYWFPYIVFEEFPVYGSLLKVDFINASLKIAVEVHGPQHGELHFFHDEKPANFLMSIKRDTDKIEWLTRNEFTICEISHEEVPTLSKEFFKEKFQIDL
jgi:hypothetical protein